MTDISKIMGITLDVISPGPSLPEDFTTYTEWDPLSKITVTTNQITINNLRKDSEANLYKDFGVDYFTDFEIQFSALSDDSSSTHGEEIVGLIGMSNAHDMLEGMNNNDDGWACTCEYQGGGGPILYLRDFVDPFPTGHIHHNQPDVTTYYTITRVGTSLTCSVYSDAARSILIGSTSITASDRPYRYLQFCIGRMPGPYGSYTSLVNIYSAKIM